MGLAMRGLQDAVRPLPAPTYQTVWDTILCGIPGRVGLPCGVGYACKVLCAGVRRSRPATAHAGACDPCSCMSLARSQTAYMRGMQGTWRTPGSMSTGHAARPAQLARAMIRVAPQHGTW